LVCESGLYIEKFEQMHLIMVCYDSKMSYVPGTLLRIFPDASSTKHFTTVVLNNNTLLEVKNPDSCAKKDVFDTVELWCEARGVPVESVKVQPPKTGQFDTPKIESSLTFNVPTDIHRAYHWVHWCYSIVCEFAPHLLENNEFNTLYNQMVDICTKYKMLLWHDTVVNRYDPAYIHFIPNDSADDNIHKFTSKYSGYMGRFFSYNGGMFFNYNDVNEEACRREVITCYEQILHIIKPHIAEKMGKKWDIICTKKNITSSTRALSSVIRRITKLKADLYYSNKLKDKTENELVTLQKKLDELTNE